MYKVKEAADALGVTRVEVFEILLSQRELFEPYVEKQNSITYISEPGLALLRQTLESGLKHQETVLGEVLAGSDELLAAANETAETEESESPDFLTDDSDADLVLETDETAEEVMLKQMGARNESVKPAVDIEASDDIIGQWLKEIQEEDMEADQQDNRLKELRTQVTLLRNKILSLDSEIKRKDEAIKHYHEIMKDDIRWLEDLERKTQLMVKHELMSMGAAQPELSEEEEDKGNFFKFFKR